MGILNTAACLLLSVAPQSVPGPAATPTPTDRPVLEFAHLFAPNTTALFVLNPLHEQWDELKSTGLGKLFAERGWLAPLVARFAEDMQDLPGRTGVSEEHWKEALQNGIAIGWAGFDPMGTPRIQGVVGLGSAESAFAAALQKWAQGLQAASPGQARAELWNETQIWEVRTGWPVAFAVHDSMLVFASSRELVESMLRRGGGQEPDALSTEPAFLAFADECEKRPVWSCFLRPAQLGSQLGQYAPDHRDDIGSAVRALGLDRMDRLTVTTHVEGDELVESLRVSFPAPQEGLLAALMGRPDRIDEDLARWVPDEATSFGFTALDFGEITREAISLLRDVAPEAGDMAVAAMDQMYMRLGVDLQDDLLATLGDHFASMQWTGPGGESRMGVVFDLRDDLRFLNAFDKLRGVLPIQAATGNQRLYRVTLPMGPKATTLSAAVHGGFLFLADSDETLQALFAREEAKPGPRVRELLRSVDSTTTMVSRTNLTEALLSVWPALQAAMGPAGIELDPSLAGHFGEVFTVGRRDEEGFVLESRSPVGGFQGALMVGVVSAIALPKLVAESETIPTAAPTDDQIAIVARLQSVQSAQLEFRAAAVNDEDGDQRGEFGTLDELLAAEMVDRKLFGKFGNHGTATSGEFLVTVLIPPTTDDREQQFVAVAWPAGAQPGPVYCALPGEPVLINEIIAGTEGLTEVDPRDVFLGGLFGSELTAGWREVEQKITTRAGSIDQDSPVLLLQAVEDSGDPEDAGQVIPLLQNEDPVIASRAAWLLGRLKAKEAVPQLCDTVKDSFDDELRKHAMAALVRIGDRRALTTSVFALGDTDPTVRTLAAANLGKIRSREAVQPLIGLLDERAGPEGDSGNVVAALLALHDIGDTEALLPAASAVRMTGTDTGTALAFLYQEMSPRLAPEEEASVLLAVLDHPEIMLRRYVVQRLGELRLESTARALEGRLAVEDEALRPLVRLSLASVRGETLEDQDWLQRAQQFAQSLWSEGKARWKSMDDSQRMVTLAGAGGFLLIVIGLLWARGRSRRKQRADRIASMVAPSQGYRNRGSAGDYDYGPDEEYYEEDQYAEEPVDTFHR